MPDFTLTVNGVTKSLAEWGVTEARLRMRSGDVGGLRLVTKEGLAAEPQWHAEEAVELHLGATRVWAGRIVPPRSTGNAGRRTKSYLAADPGWWLANLMFMQDWMLGGTVNVAAFGRAFLFVNGRTTAQEITAAVQRCIDATPVAAPIAVGSIGGTLAPPGEAVENRTCLQVIQRCMEREMDGASWWKFDTVGAPEFHYARYADLTTVTLASNTTSEIEVEECYEQRVPFVQVILKKQVETETGDPPYWTEITGVVYPADYFAEGSTGTRFGGLSFSIDYDENFNETDSLAAATQVYDAADHLAWRGAVTVPGARPDFAVRPGVKLNVTGQRAAWATMGALVQEVDHDLMHGTTRARFGPPEHLSFSDLRAMARAMRGTRPRQREIDERDTGESSSQNYGFDKRDDSADADEVVLTVLAESGWETLRLKVLARTPGAAPGAGEQVPTITDGTGGFGDSTNCTPLTPP